MARRGKRKQQVRIAVDPGTPETRRRCTPDPLLDSSLPVHRAEAGRAIRLALEEGLDAASLDIVRIGLGGGSTGYSGGWTPLEHLIDARGHLDRWRWRCRQDGFRHDLAELWACGASIRQIAGSQASAGLNRPQVTAAIEAAIDLYADMRGYSVPSPHGSDHRRKARWQPLSSRAGACEG